MNCNTDYVLPESDSFFPGLPDYTQPPQGLGWQCKASAGKTRPPAFAIDLAGKTRLNDFSAPSVTFELATPYDYSVKSRKIRYTTMLKTKGLERDVVCW